MHLLASQAADAPARLPLSASAPTAAPPHRATPGTLAPDEIRRLVLEILG